MALQTDIAALRKERTEFVEKNRKLKKKLSEIVHSGASTSDEDEDAANKTMGAAEAVPADSAAATSTTDDPAKSTPKESETDNLLNEMEKLKSYLNNVELQLYEANEKISELQESVCYATLCNVPHITHTFRFSFSEATIRGGKREAARREYRTQ